jgi:hypothetical protein
MSTNEEQMLGYAAASEFKTNHLLHLIITLVTVGLWSWVWLWISAGNIKKRNEIKKKVGLPTELNIPNIILWINTIFVLFVIFVLTVGSKASQGLPACDSSDAKKTLEEAFNESQFARQMSLSVVEITDTVDTGNGENKELRECKAKAYLNNSEDVKVSYQLKARKDGTYLLEFKVVD